MKQAKQQLIDTLDEFMQGYFSQEELEKAIRIQPGGKWGDLSLECFSLENKLEYPSGELAADLLEKIPEFGAEFEKVEEVKGFLNFHLDQVALVERTLTEIQEKKTLYGSNNLGENKKAVFDYSAPNIGKPLHVGHIRSTILGDSLIKIMQFSGYQTHGINYLGDVGLHIGKILHAYKTEGSQERLERDPEGELLNLYVSFCQKEKADESLLDLARTEVQLVEEKDPQTVQLLDLITKQSFISFDRIYNLLDIHIDETIGQSQFSDPGRKIVQLALEKGLAEKTENGAIIMQLKDYGLPNKVILRSDGTAIYSTQDLGAATTRFQDHQFDRLLYVVGDAQALYFQQLFKSLELLGYDWADRCEHVGFGLINLEEGKMATREGKLVYLEELLLKAKNTAAEIIKKHNPELADKDEVAKKVGIGAIKYQVLGVDNTKDIKFSWKRALNFNGKSAPNIQYTYVRANSILEKANWQQQPDFIPEQLTGPEYALVRKMSQLPLLVESAVKTLKPHLLANYAYDLASTFNQLYSSVKLLEDQDKQQSRMVLLDSYKTTIQNTMNLLGIQMPEKM